MGKIAPDKPEDRAIRYRARENPCISGLDPVRDRSLTVEPFIQSCGARQFDEFARNDEDQFSAFDEMANALFDEEQKKIGARIEKFRFETCAGVRLDDSKAHIGGVSDDGFKAFAFGQVEEIHDPRSRRCDPRIQFNGQTARQMLREGPLPRRWFQYPSAIRA